MISFSNVYKYVSEKEIEKFHAENESTIKSSMNFNEKYADSLGWMHTEKWAGQAAIQRINQKAKEIQNNADAFVLVGVGGSNQAARAVIKALNSKEVEIIYAGNTLSAYEINEMLKSLEGKNFYIDVIAKNFETLEPGASFRVLRAVLEKKYGKKANERIIVTGTKGSHLEELADKHGYDFFTFPDDIGGRYSVLSDVGLLPMAVAGVNIKKLVKGAEDAQKELLCDYSVDNPAVKYAIIRNMLYTKGYRMEMMSFFEPRLKYFSKWWTQLMAESEGKDDKGIYPVTGQYSEDLHSIGQFVQDGSKIIFETFLKVKHNAEDTDVIFYPDEIDDRFDYLNDKGFLFVNNSAERATICAHSKSLPCIEVEIDKLDEYNLGRLFYTYMIMISISGALFGINPYDQNGVEAYKQQMFKILKKSDKE